MRIRRLMLVGLISLMLPALASEPLPKIRIAPDGRTFVTDKGQPFVPFGVNYYRPGTGWAPQVWKKFDAEATRRDFTRMRELGVNCVRVFLSYASFYDRPGVLNAEGIAKFDQFLVIAEETGIYVHPAGPDHWEGRPAWVGHDRLPDVGALESFWKLFAARYRGRNVIWAYDLRNEPEMPWDTPVLRGQWYQWLTQRYGSVTNMAQAWGLTNHPPVFGGIAPPPTQDTSGHCELLDYQHFREDIADEWTRRQVAAIKSADPAALVTMGLIQWSVPSKLPSLQSYSAFRPARQAKFLDFLEVHFYPLEHGGYHYEGETAELRNRAYLESVVREVAAPGKPVVLAEFGWYGGGLPSRFNKKFPVATEEQQARWCRRVVKTSAGLAIGWLCWGFYDIPESTDCSQFSGMVTADGQTKAWGREFQRLSAKYAGQHIPPAQLSWRPALDWDACITSLKALDRFREDYIHAFMAAQKK